MSTTMVFAAVRTVSSQEKQTTRVYGNSVTRVNRVTSKRDEVHIA